jgi:cytochrome c oxidase subunit 4
MSHPTETQQTGHIISYAKLTAVWLGLLALTALTVWVAKHQAGFGHAWGSLAIACIKGGLVIAFFMHMRYEGRLLRGLFFVAFCTLAIFIGFTFFDLLYR